jgi:hypothetical protein
VVAAQQLGAFGELELEGEEQDHDLDAEVAAIDVIP